jgi:biopolymer transport protein TolR
VIQIAWMRDNEPPSVKINEESVNWEDLHDRLFDIFKQRAERVAFVKGDDDVDFQYVADAIAIARGSGVERIGLLTRTGQESP